MEPITPKLFFGKVVHTRLFPKYNHFTYRIYYLLLALSKIKNIPLAHNRFAPLSFYDQDHGLCDGSDLETWARSLLAKYKIDTANGEIALICMPRVLGYVFNPVSFWLCYDKEKSLRAVLCEVHNTFGERHTYLCAHPDQSPIGPRSSLKGSKVFHVSPMLERQGHYEFRFNAKYEKFRVCINYFDVKGNKQLVTSLVGKFEIMQKKTLRKAFWAYPLMTFKAIYLIHWQALKLLTKGIKYRSRPPQKTEPVSSTEKLSKTHP